jgi:hypothetical protein
MCRTHMCLKEESADHLLFKCPIAVATWCWVRDSLGWEGAPSSINSFHDIINNSGGDHICLCWWVMAAVGWSL